VKNASTGPLFFHDGSLWHKDIIERDVGRTVALVDNGYSVLRSRDRLKPIPGAVNVQVDSSKGVKAISQSVAQALGVRNTEWSNMWRKADSLARRAILQLSQRYAQVRQTSMHEFTAVVGGAADTDK
jgi:hypothetical protein